MTNNHMHFCPVCQGTWDCTDSECHPDDSELECPSCDGHVGHGSDRRSGSISA